MNIENYDDLDPEFQDLLDDDEIPDKGNTYDELELQDLFSDSFVEEYTAFSRFDQFVKESGYTARELQKSILERKSNEDFDRFVCENSEFEDWLEMVNHALWEDTDSDLLI